MTPLLEGNPDLGYQKKKKPKGLLKEHLGLQQRFHTIAAITEADPTHNVPAQQQMEVLYQATAPWWRGKGPIACTLLTCSVHA